MNGNVVHDELVLKFLGQRPSAISMSDYVPAIDLAYIDSSANVVPVTFDQLKNLYVNSGVFSEGEVALTFAEVFNAEVDTGVVLALRTHWETEDGRFYSVASQIFQVPDNSGYILGNGPTAMDITSTCTCARPALDNWCCSMISAAPPVISKYSNKPLGKK
ncbi:MAG: hypothetical protein QM642_03140 [Edaphocola sp.]